MIKSAPFLLSIFVSLTSLVSHSQEDAAARVCPTEKTPAAVSAWRVSAIADIANGKYSDVQSEIKTCFGDTVPSCLNDMNYYVNHKVYTNSTALTERYLELEELYNNQMPLTSASFLPTEFLEKNESGEIVPNFVVIPENLTELSRAKNWLTTSYKTRELGGFDDSNNLLIVAIPSERRDTVLQISIAKDAQPFESILDPITRPHNGNLTGGFETLTMITVDKTTNPPLGQLRILKKSPIKPNSYYWNPETTNTIGTRSCISCHSTPFRAISPVGYKFTNEIKTAFVTGQEKRMDREHESTVNKINELLSRSGVSWGTAKKDNREVRFGPDIDSQPWGWAPAGSMTRKQEFIEKCASERTAFSATSRAGGHYRAEFKPDETASVNWQKVAKAMNCISCHNGKNRGIIHNEFSPSTVAFKIIATREMPESDDPENPLAPELNTDERLALYSCLQKERLTVAQEWKKSGWWMTRTKCK